MSGLSDRFRDLLVDACRRVGPNPVVLLSGGLDSGAILAAMVESGRDFDVVTLRFGDEEGEDEKAAKARFEAVVPERGHEWPDGSTYEHRDASFHVVEVPKAEEEALRHACWAIRSSGAVLKTGIEVSVAVRPMIYQLTARCKDLTLVNGMTGGLLWGVGKEAMMTLRRDGGAAWTAQRRSWLRYEDTGYPPNGTRLCRLAARQLGMRWEDPLADPAVAELMLGTSYEELNKPRAKALAVAAFPVLAATPAVSGGLQVMAGVRELMQGIAERRGHGTAMRLYGNMARAMGMSPRGSEAAKAAWGRI